jgi:AcrR family transcriptional regulator
MATIPRREQILQAAERLLGRYGPAKTTMADVAREAEIGVGTVYLEFPSKDAIIEELSGARYRAMLAAMREAATSSRPHGERLVAMFESRTKAFVEIAEKGAHACDLVHCMSPAVKAAQGRFREDERALLVELLRSGARAGKLSVSRPEAVARAVLRAYATFCPPWLDAIPKDELRPALSAMNDLILSGLLPRAP